MFYSILRFVYNGYKRPLTNDDFWSLDDSDSTESCVKRLEYEWNKVFKIYTEAEEIVVESSNADSLFVNFLNLIIFLYFILNKMFLSYRKILNQN
jgi:hypothetical protein